MPLIEPDEPYALELINGDSDNNLILVCDHASNRVPRGLGDLGLTPEQLGDHIGWDKGAAAVARALSELLDAPLVLANYSRLVIDCNRSPDSSDSIAERSDGVVIPGNAGLTAEQRAQRITEIFDPYHAAIAALVDDRSPDQTVIMAIHSFTHVLAGQTRPWSLGVCYGDDRRLADPFLAALGPELGSQLGDNEPYTIEEGVDYTLPCHAGKRGLRHVMFEISRDQIDTDADATRWASLLARTWLKIHS